MVPRTELVSLSSPAFFYDWIDRTAAKNGKPLPEKIGSMQYFMHGFTDASDFLRKHPWPGRAISDTFDDSNHRTGNISKRFMSALNIICGKTGGEDDAYDEADDDRVLYDATEEANVNRPFYWSESLQQSFREELEKLVILDYLMRNTDRGADNYMIKYCEGVSDKNSNAAPSRPGNGQPQMSELKVNEAGSSHQPSWTPAMSIAAGSGCDGRPTYTSKPHIHIAAIDNSLSFPHEHPKGWRSYTYGWLFLPVSIVGRPFSEKTRNHFLPLLTSKEWWAETTYELRKLFEVDPDFHPKMFRRQLAVMKGQAYNIVQSLKHVDEGPLELTRREKVLVWDDELEVAEESLASAVAQTPESPQISINTVPLPRHSRSQSLGARDFPPPIRRTSTELNRPVPFSAKFQRVHPATTGVTVLEHMERLDKVEASLARLGNAQEEDEEEADVVESRPIAVPLMRSSSSQSSSSGTPLLSPRSAPLPVVPEAPSAPESLGEVDEQTDEPEPTEEDVAALSKSMSHLEVSPSRLHTRWGSHEAQQQGPQSLDWMLQTEAEGTKKRIAIVERLEPVKTKPLLSWW
ncbi:hypothetical protein PUNSTDRAFT_83863 [Punctularia strigosozonata HHB-11173 SS5]|uniref:uncharacterized protein n=1 Tax=Punctularia strigosozonata (strain HHB-11173) TaxID=741275 RepID=UPI0004416595|nr:uncharacterized protein PUNSTDRAFT_83863 [Punctularia strigosozonata HHB-11173 SS5]EIN11984.1 hypothetical protein PUNSTDRAFT_83863 [Punctularia strigosozonata HHB-11173 SS5]